MRGSTLLSSLLTFASVAVMGLSTASAQTVGVGGQPATLPLDKTQVVCASVFPCHPTTFRLLPQFSNPTSVEGAFCVEFVYKPICKAAQKFKHEQKREKQNKGKQNRGKIKGRK